MNIEELIYRLGIVPVIKIEEPKDAKPLGEALIKGGLPIAEVTLRTPAAFEAMQLMKDEFPEMCIGAGTVSTIEEVDKAILSGAEFIVSPGYNSTLVQYCLDKKIPVIPGCSTATEIEMALLDGLTTIKLFPAEASGGSQLIKSLSGPYPNVNFLPTGGINLDNIEEYLSIKQVVACGGSWMVSEELIRKKRFDLIQYKTQEAVKKLLGFELCGFKLTNNKFLESIAAFLEILQINRDCEVSSSLDECIIIKTNNLVRAQYHLERRGFIFNEKKYINFEGITRPIITLENQVMGVIVAFTE